MQQIFDFLKNNWSELAGGSIIAGRVYQAIISGGGIKGILSAIWLGTNTPKKSITFDPNEQIGK